MTDKFAAFEAELAIVFETLNGVDLPRKNIEAIYKAHTERVLKKHGMDSWSIVATFAKEITEIPQ